VGLYQPQVNSVGCQLYNPRRHGVGFTSLLVRCEGTDRHATNQRAAVVFGGPRRTTRYAMSGVGVLGFLLNGLSAEYTCLIFRFFAQQTEAFPFPPSNTPGSTKPCNETTADWNALERQMLLHEHVAAMTVIQVQQPTPRWHKFRTHERRATTVNVLYHQHHHNYHHHRLH